MLLRFFKWGSFFIFTAYTKYEIRNTKYEIRNMKYEIAKNTVLSDEHRQSRNFFDSDLMLQHLLHANTSALGLSFMQPHLSRLGEQAAGEMNPLSLRADKESPRHIKRNFFGETIDQIEFHPDYWRLTQIAIDSQMFRLKWQPELRQAFAHERNLLSFAAGYLFAMSESGLYCPLCMTDGVALLLDKYANYEDKARLLPHIYSSQLADFYTGAMFLTEKAGGSDVGANLATARHIDGDYYQLNGEKWFCSNANAQIIFALARTNPDKKGTSGLGIFLIERQRPDGSPNPMELVRLKDKLGVRSMASGEYIFRDTVGKLIGQPTEGFKIMTDMINLSRLYNSMAAFSAMRRALVETYQFLNFRHTFGKNALQHALIREKLHELGALNVANFYLTWRAIQTLDAAEAGDSKAAELLRLLTPMVKKCTAQDAVYSVRESMELMGGMGYIEDGVMPKIMRDVMVLPIWEGAGNIMLLDMLRASLKSKGLTIILHEISDIFAQNSESADFMPLVSQLQADISLILAQTEQDIIETSIKPAFERLTRLYQIALLFAYRDDDSQIWINPAIDYWRKNLLPRPNSPLFSPPSSAQISDLMAWHF
jgi:acyl-CoA dehydrogenase